MMLTTERHAALVTMAGTDFMWDAAPTCTLARVQVHGLREYMRQAQGGLCAACGMALNEYGEMCHVVSAGPKSRGWVEGNIYLGHSACNEADRQHGAIVPLSSILRSDLILTEWPDATARRVMGEVQRDKTRAMVAEKQALRGL
jgi:hypothetical protein